MNRQICRVCGTEIITDGSGTMTFCTGCGASLVNQNYSPGYNPNVQPTALYPKGETKKPLSSNEKLAFGAMIGIPLALVLGSIAIIGVVGFSIYNKIKNYEPSPYPTPSSSPAKSKNSLLTFGSDGLGEGQFKKASAIAVGKDGSIYVGDGTLRIQKFDANGKFVKLWNVSESAVKTNDQYTNNISNLAIDSKNILYAAIENKELLRYDGNTGKFIDKVVLNGEKWMNKPQEARVMDMFMQNDDKLAVFAASFPEGEYLIIVSPDGKAEIRHKNLLKTQKKNSQPMMSGGILVSVTGDIFLLDGYVAVEKKFIYRFKSDGSYVDRFTWDGAPANTIFSNNYIALNSKGEIYALNNAKKQINVLNVEGVLQRSIPLDALYVEKFIVDSNDNIFILSSNKIEKYSSAGGN